jgi:predicted DNA-binding ribbon-helix-helix protein
MAKDLMRSAIVKRSIVLKGHKTSVSLEEPFWSGLWEIARNKGYTLSGLVAQIDAERRGSNLSSALRLHVLEHYKGLIETRSAREGARPSEPLSH